MDIVAIVRVLQRKKWVLISVPLFAIVCTIFFLSRADKQYKSKAQIATGYTTDDVIRLTEEKASTPFEVNTRFINTIESMKSIPVMSLVTYQLMLHDLESEQPFRKLERSDDLPFNLAKPEEAESIKRVLRDCLIQFKTLNPLDSAHSKAISVVRAYGYDAETLIENFYIERQSSSDFITVEITTENPLLSAFSVNILCQEFIRFNRVLKQDRSTESVEVLQAQLEERRRIRDEKLDALNNFKSSNGVISSGTEGGSQVAEYESARDNEIKKISGLELSLNNIENRIQNFNGFSTEDQVKVNQRIAKLRADIRELSTADAEANKDRIAQLRSELQNEFAKLETLTKASTKDELKSLMNEREKVTLDLQIARSNLTSIEASLRRARFQVSGLSSKETRLAELEGEAAAASDAYIEAQEKYSSAKNKASLIGSTLRQILQGQPSNEPEPTKAVLLAGLAGVGSLVFCIMVILGVEFLNFQIRTAERLEYQTGLRSVGMVNEVDMRTFDLQRFFLEKGRDRSSSLFVHFLRKLRFEVQHSKSKIILLTSTQPSAGKSFLTTSIAYTMSMINKRVLIIDTNFKTSTLTKTLIPKVDKNKLLRKGMVNEKMLLPQDAQAARYDEHLFEDDEPAANAKSNKKVDEQPSQGLIYKTRFRGIDVIGNLGGIYSPSEIFAGKDFSEMLKNLAMQYDYVLLEGPALNEFSDTKELVDYAEKVLVVFDANATISSMDRDSIKYLKSLKGKLMGAVLNRVSLKDLAGIRTT